MYLTSKKILHVVNPNGLGHLRRSIFIWNNLKICNADVTIIIDHSQKFFLKFFKPKSYITFEFFDFSGMIALPNLKGEYFSDNYFKFHENFYERFKQTVDLLISDNTLLEFKKISKNYIVIGSFFWHDLISENSTYNKVYLNELKLLESHKPNIYGIKNFISGTLGTYENTHEVGWLIDRKKINKSKNTEIGILFSGGLGDLELSYFDNILNLIDKKLPDATIYCSHRYSFIKNSKPFDFSEDWSKINFVIARPGIGTISDCIENMVPIISIGEKTNLEISHNAKSISNLEIGFDYVNKTFDLDFINALDEINYQKIDSNGLSLISEIILNIIYKQNL